MVRRNACSFFLFVLKKPEFISPMEHELFHCSNSIGTKPPSPSLSSPPKFDISPKEKHEIFFFLPTIVQKISQAETNGQTKVAGTT